MKPLHLTPLLLTLVGCVASPLAPIAVWEGVVDSTPDRAHLVLERLRAAYTAARVIAARHEFGACGRADGADVEAVKQRTIARQRVDIRCFEVGVAVNAQVAPALIVSHTKDYVGPRRLGALCEWQNKQQRGEE